MTASFIQEFSETDNRNIQTDLIIMDFAKAFDKVPHRRLLYKLNYWSVFLLKYTQIYSNILKYTPINSNIHIM